MKYSLALLVLITLTVPTLARGQRPAPADEVPNAKPCLIVKHQSTTDQWIYWPTLIGVPIIPKGRYDHIHAVNFDKSKQVYKGSELKEFHDQGVRVIILKNNFTQQDLDDARSACREPNSPPPQHATPPSGNVVQ